MKSTLCHGREWKQASEARKGREHLNLGTGAQALNILSNADLYHLVAALAWHMGEGGGDMGKLGGTAI